MSDDRFVPAELWRFKGDTFGLQVETNCPRKLHTQEGGVDWFDLLSLTHFCADGLYQTGQTLQMVQQVQS